jgi:predicted N-acetyltransferase YhbS
VEVQVRDARLTDIDRITTVVERAGAQWTAGELSDAADLLRRMIYLPNAAVLAALDGRAVVGVAVLSLRPSVVAGGLVGTIDLLSVDPGQHISGVTEALLREVTRSARNKGCVVLDASPPEDPAELMLWQRAGFVESGVRFSCPVASAAKTTW